MTLLSKAVEDKRLDTRIVERNVTRGVVSTDEVDKSVKSLQDDAANAEYVALDSFKDTDTSSRSNGQADTHH